MLTGVWPEHGGCCLLGAAQPPADSQGLQSAGAVLADSALEPSLIVADSRADLSPVEDALAAARNQHLRGHLASAAGHYRLALRRLHENAADEFAIAKCEGGLASVLDEAGSNAEAMKLFDRSVGVLDRADDGSRIAILNNYAIALRHEGWHDRAMLALLSAEALVSRSREPAHSAWITLGINKAITQLAMGKIKAARISVRRAARRLDAPGPAVPVRLQADLQLNWGTVCAASGWNARAGAKYAGAMRLYAQVEGSERDLVRCKINLATMVGPGGSVSEAHETLRRAADYLGDIGLRHESAKARVMLGALLVDCAHWVDAEEAYEEAYRELATLEGGERLQARCAVNLADLLLRRGRPFEAVVWAAPAAVVLDAYRYQLARFDSRRAWRAGESAKALQIALACAVRCGDRRLVADLVAVSRLSLPAALLNGSEGPGARLKAPPWVVMPDGRRALVSETERAASEYGMSIEFLRSD